MTPLPNILTKDGLTDVYSQLQDTESSDTQNSSTASDSTSDSSDTGGSYEYTSGSDTITLGYDPNRKSD